MPTLKSISGVRDYLYDPKSGIIHVRFWVANERKTRSTGVKGKIPPSEYDIKMAISAGRKIIENFDKEKELSRATAKGVNLVCDWVPKWLESLQTTWKSKAAIRDARSRWECHLSKFFFERKGKYLDIKEAATEGMWLEYAVQFQKKHPGKLLSHHRAYLRHFFYYMHEQRDPKTNERLLLTVPDLKDYDSARETPGRSITPEEETALLKACSNREQRLYVLMGIYMGMRPGEVCTCLKSFINWETMEIDLPPTFVKTGRIKRSGRRVPIHPKVKKDLREQYDSHKYDPLFPSPLNAKKTIARDGNKKAWARIKRDANIKGKMRRHDMRVTRATRFAEQGIADQLAQEVLGMSGEVMKRHYTKFSAKVRKKVYERES